MKKVLLTLCLLALLFPTPIFAIEDPLALPNNKYGIHILFDNELPDAAKLVNGNGGEWGYVTIPIQTGDKDITKWQNFMDAAKKYHIIPIVRLASEGDYFNTKVWKKPTYEDVVDFANFLDSLSWPTKNRYIIVFNETNRGDEWGGEVNPAEYAELLSFAVTVFKSKNQDFFIISSGMDNAAPEQAPDYMNEYNYLRKMHEAIPGIFNQIDGFASHAYPNPGFAQPPETVTTKSISSFIYERNLVRDLRNKDIPIFITETGWNAIGISDEMKASYYLKAFTTAWADPGIVAITPFLFRAGGGPFTGFSFLDANGGETSQYKTMKQIAKIKGQPTLNTAVLGAEKNNIPPFETKSFSQNNTSPKTSLSQTAQKAFKWIMKL
jgi:hypothetical protein